MKTALRVLFYVFLALVGGAVGCLGLYVTMTVRYGIVPVAVVAIAAGYWLSWSISKAINSESVAVR